MDGLVSLPFSQPTTGEPYRISRVVGFKWTATGSHSGFSVQAIGEFVDAVSCATTANSFTHSIIVSLILRFVRAVDKMDSSVLQFCSFLSSLFVDRLIGAADRRISSSIQVELRRALHVCDRKYT